VPLLGIEPAHRDRRRIEPVEQRSANALEKPVEVDRERGLSPELRVRRHRLHIPRPPTIFRGFAATLDIPWLARAAHNAKHAKSRSYRLVLALAGLFASSRSFFALRSDLPRRPESQQANIIRNGELQTLPTAIQPGREAGMIPLERSLARLVESGAVAPAAIEKIAADHDLLASLADKLR
jgi:hypothetical protein